MKNYRCGVVAVALVVVVVWALQPAGAFAQLGTKLSLGFDYIPPSKLADPIPGVPGSDTAEWEFMTGTAELTFPLFVVYEDHGEYQIPTRGVVSTLAYQDKYIQESILNNDDEHYRGFKYTAAYFRKLSDVWYLNVIAGAGIAANDLGEVEADDWKYQGGLYFDRHTSSGWTWGLGLIFDQYTGEDLLAPYVHLSKEGEKHKFELMTPAITYNYKLNPSTNLGIKAVMEGNLFAVSSAGNATLYDAQGNIVRDDVGVELAFSEIRFGPHLELNPEASNWTLVVDAGISAARRFEFLAQGEGETLRFAPGSDGAGEELNFAPEPQVFAKVVIGYEF